MTEVPDRYLEKILDKHAKNFLVGKIDRFEEARNEWEVLAKYYPREIKLFWFDFEQGDYTYLIKNLTGVTACLHTQKFRVYGRAESTSTATCLIALVAVEDHEDLTTQSTQELDERRRDEEEREYYKKLDEKVKEND